jgi:hypothetical protein
MAKIDSGLEFDKEKNHKNMTDLMKNKDTKQYPLRIPASLYKKVRIKLMHEDRNLRELILDMLNLYIKE